GDKSLGRDLAGCVAAPAPMVAHDSRLAHGWLLRIPRDTGGFLVSGSGASRISLDCVRCDGPAAWGRRFGRTLRFARSARFALLVFDSVPRPVGVRDLAGWNFRRYGRMARPKVKVISGRKDPVASSFRASNQCPV